MTRDSSEAGSRRVDTWGQVLLVAVLASGVAAVIEVSRLGVGAPMVLTSAALCLGAAGWLGVRARRGSPALPLEQLRRRGVAAAVVVGALLNVSFFGVVFALGLALQREHDLAPVVAGAVLLPASVVIPVANVAATAGVRRWGARGSLARGMVCEAIGFLLTGAAGLAPHSSAVVIALALVPVGAGAGWASPSMMTLLMDSVSTGRDGQMVGFLDGARQAGSAIGVAVAGMTVIASPTLTVGAFRVCAASGALLAIAALTTGPRAHTSR